MGRKKLGEILIERGIIDHDQLNAALAYQRQWGHRLGVALVAKGFVTEGALVQVLGEVLKMQVVDLSEFRFEPAVLKLLPSQVCESNDLIPLALEPGRSRGKDVLVVAMAEPLNLSVIDEIEFTTNCRVRPVLATISAISSSIRKHYKGQDTTIKPLDALQRPKTQTGKMVLVRPGGETELVDTTTREPGTSSKEAPSEPIAEQVSRIKARRAERIASSDSLKAAEKSLTSEEVLKQYLTEVQNRELEALTRLEKYFWALMRVMAKKGLVTKEEFLREINK